MTEEGKEELVIKKKHEHVARLEFRALFRTYLRNEITEIDHVMKGSDFAGSKLDEAKQKLQFALNRQENCLPVDKDDAESSRIKRAFELACNGSTFQEMKSSFFGWAFQ
jgi:uncharacterized protein YnzC (UPF0291/DUF896 family)